MDLAESIGLTVVESRTSSGNPPLEDGEQVLQSFDDVQLVLSSDTDQGLGKVFITEGRIFWLSSKDPSIGFCVDFPTISMHAIATDPESVDRPCMYVQLDTGDDDNQGPTYDDDGDDDNDNEEEEDQASLPPLPELRLIPADALTLEAMFKSFCEGAERNPDADAEEEGQGNLFFDRSEVLAGAFHPSIDDMDELVGGDPERFGDADEEGDEFEEFEGAPQNGV